MPPACRQMKLGVSMIGLGYHVAAWRHPEAPADGRMNIAHYVEITRTAERGKFDMVFLADGVGVRDTRATGRARAGPPNVAVRAADAAVGAGDGDEAIGLVATASTSYNEPFHVARKFASLDHISGGRAGWNLVTSGQETEAQNFGRDKHSAHGERYERAREFARSWPACGTAGTTMPSSATRRAGVLRPGEAASAQPQGRELLRARSAQHPAHAAGSR